MATAKNTGGVAVDQLRSFVERVERAEEEIAEAKSARREIYAEAKATGFDVKALRQVIRLRKMEANDRQEQEEILSLYKRAIGLDD